jgi:hypothetical protein
MNDQTNHKDHVLSRIYREGAWPEPSRQIDQAILAASRRERSFARRWAPSFAIAATVVLASTLALKVYREQPDVISPSPPDTTSRDKPPSAPEKPAETNAAETKPAAPTAPPVQPVATPKGFSSTMDAGEAERLDRIQRELDLKRGPPPSGSPVPGAGYTPAQRSAFAEKAPPALKKEAPASAPAPALSPRAAAGKPVAPFASTRESVPPQPQALEAERDRMQASPPAPQAPAVSPPAAAAPAPAPAAPAAGATAISGSALGTTTLTINRAAAKASERSPQTWVEDIRKLMAAGRSEEAGQEIAELKKRYPDYALPDDLR